MTHFSPFPQTKLIRTFLGVTDWAVLQGTFSSSSPSHHNTRHQPLLNVRYNATLSCPVLPCPVLSYPLLSCPVLSCPVLSCPALSCPALSCPVLSCPALSCPALSCPVLSCPVLSSPVITNLIYRLSRHSVPSTPLQLLYP
jgi:hypothetical protein